MFGYSNKSITFDYKKEKSFEERLQESNKVKDKYTDKIPIIVTKSSQYLMIWFYHNFYILSGKGLN